MARKPAGVHWERPRRTEAKHQVLSGYLNAWIPILGSKAEHLVLVDGFAGPGRYTSGEPGSPLLMLDAYLRRHDRSRLGVQMHYFFIERQASRFRALEGEIAKRKLDPNEVEVRTINGSYDEELPRVLEDVKKRLGQPPIFLFIDPFGAQDNHLDLTSRVLLLPRCEILTFVPLGHFARFVESPDVEETLDSLYGTDRWREARALNDVAERRKLLHDVFREQLEGSCKWVRSFEIVPSSGGNRAYLFFGTSNRVGLARMKEAMWKLDPAAGQSFRDTTMVDQPVLFEREPDLAPLRTALRDYFGQRPFSIEEAEDFTLTTPFRHDAHLKQKTLRPLEREGRLEVITSTRKRRGYFPPGTRSRFTN